MDNGKDIKDKLNELFKRGESKVSSISDKEQKFLKHLSEINAERQKLMGKEDKWKIPKLLLTIMIVGIGIFIMFLPEKSIIGKSIFSFNPPPSLKIDVGKYTIINFFASWCDICEEEIPELVKLQNENGKVSIIGIAVKDTKEKIDELAKRYNINYQIIFDTDGKFARNLGIDAIPTTLIVSDDSKIRKIIYGPVSTEKIERIIRKLESQSR